MVSTSSGGRKRAARERSLLRQRLQLWTLVIGGAAAVTAMGIYLGSRDVERRPPASAHYDDQQTRFTELPIGQSQAIRLRTEGYTNWSRASPPQRPSDQCGRLLFAGHVYPKNGVVDPAKASYPDPHGAMSMLLEAERRLAPDRIVFGGDTIRIPSPAGTDFIAKLASDLPHVRFIVGNHERWWSKGAARLREILGERHGVEDLAGVRLIRLHSIRQNGSFGLDDEERAFLRSALDGEGYEWAIVMLHHALWAGDTPWVNRDYPGAVRLREDWLANVLPLLRSGRVRAVLVGDGGWRRPGGRMTLDGIPHFTTGWSGWEVTILPEWLMLDLCEDGPIVSRHVAFEQEFLHRLEWPREP